MIKGNVLCSNGRPRAGKYRTWAEEHIGEGACRHLSLARRKLYGSGSAFTVQ